jgi:ribosomal protein S5
LKQETVGIGFLPKQTDAGEKSGFRAVLAVGNDNVYLGVGDEGTHRTVTHSDSAG